MERAISTTPAVETWRPIAEWEGLYEVSSLARVRSVDRYIEVTRRNGTTFRRHVRSRIIKSYIDRYGYLIVPLISEGVTHSVLVHRIVAKAFIPNPDNLPEVNHKDENKTNNDINNLEWCDHIYNTRYGTGQKRAGLKRAKPVEQLTMSGEHVGYYESVKAAAKACGFDKDVISKVCRGLRDDYKGYQWRYVN